MTATDKWTAAMLSLAAPGAGQLWARSWTCLSWFALAGSAVALASRASAPWAPGLALLAVALASSRAAKRRLEFAPTWAPSRAALEQVYWRPSRGRAVAMGFSLRLGEGADVVWPRVADVGQFLRIDPFHVSVEGLRADLAPGSPIALEHCAFGLRTIRFGRLLRWREGHGYAFSDLSRRGPTAGFPHVFHVALEPLPDGCLLSVDVRGKWTSRWIPLSLGQWWLRCVNREHAHLLRRAM